ncbi:hypothetical protein HETIRDRAFT_57382 [Heterobasidion irregulare TC 32-1]|uniref:Deacetylase sirtuin-type domain-containing protein n=1 Tax=Heterobasidion irregulare (strain TC 32-1) TaxID=747525 RepID=W4JMA4_HETIT|nr:uncharacterized protein HETIRDRAFT_57382 [Heterobasidion irregulare TC 32-1]ETW74594.1 hypothetical protein HETIRDRAFT_57382 [Heterobasidion irregulare TC 32-1]
MPPSTSIVEFREALRASRNIVAIAGAGLSAASGIPTFRDSGGYWKNFDLNSIATPQSFQTNPNSVWQFYLDKYVEALQAQPNPAHLAVAVLCIPERLHVLAPEAIFTLVTQNVDGLTHSPSTSPYPMFEMHGRLDEVLCTLCGQREKITKGLLSVPLEDYSVRTDVEKQALLNDLPRCSHCSSLLRPGVVWFEETPLHLREIWDIIDRADMCLVIGTSSTVQPAAGFAHVVSERGGTVAVFNLKLEESDDEPDFLFLGSCEQTLPRVLFAIDV